jgi:lysyl endopeptidase
LIRGTTGRVLLGLVAATVTTVAVTGVALADEQDGWSSLGTAAAQTATGTTTGAAGSTTNTAAVAGGLIGGAVQQVDGTLDRDGKWSGGQRELTYTYPGASYVKVHFERMTLRDGDAVVVTDRAGQESYRYTPQSLPDDHWAMSVTGDTAVVRLEQGHIDPLGLRSRLTGDGVGVDRVVRGSSTDEAGTAPQPTNPNAKRTESICGPSDDKRDAPCYRGSHPVEYQQSKAVARLLINGVELCTAWRAGPNNRMFTNHHCLASTNDVRHSEIWFNYECAQCEGVDTLRVTKVWGDRLLATDDTLDYSLFSVQNFDAVTRFGYLDLDARTPRAGEELYIPQHPRGAPTMIALDEPGERTHSCLVDDPSFYGYAAGTDLSYYCDTEGGSSGSPVLAANSHKVLALHHFGGCPNSGVRMDLIYRQVGGLL